jgi:8-oxo-dGTP diphosphatase
MSERKQVAVAAAVIFRDGPQGRAQEREFLLGQRAPGTFYPGYWEFPGGKVEPGEAPVDALKRELDEELGIRVEHCTPWITLTHEYEHAHVRLHFFRVERWSGRVHDHVHSALAWQTADALTVSPMLPANGPVMKSLRLPSRMAVTHAFQIGTAAQLDAIRQACHRGRLVLQIREPVLDAPALDFAREAIRIAHGHGSPVVLNGSADAAQALGADGVHLKAAQLAGLAVRPDFEWVGASCHTADELAQAVRLGLDYAVAGSVLPTASHPDGDTLGWDGFSTLIAGSPLPVFAIGGLDDSHLARAQDCGAHGIAAIRGAWVL